MSIEEVLVTADSLISAVSGPSFFEQLRPASYRGVPFFVLGGEGHFGRRNAVHEYPKRDKPWVEDMGRAARRINMQAFLVGDDVMSQREEMIAAAESPGDGELVHPTLGRLTVSLLDFGSSERWDKGRYFELSFYFIEAGTRIFPATTSSTTDAVSAAAAGADSAATADFTTRAAAALKHGAAVVKAAVDTASTWARKAQRLANDATNLYHKIQSLPGTFGRYFGGRRKGFGNFTTAIQQTGASVRQLIGLGSVARKHVSDASATLLSVGEDLGL